MCPYTLYITLSALVLIRMVINNHLAFVMRALSVLCAFCVCLCDYTTAWFEDAVRPYTCTVKTVCHRSFPAVCSTRWGLPTQSETEGKPERYIARTLTWQWPEYFAEGKALNCTQVGVTVIWVIRSFISTALVLSCFFFSWISPWKKKKTIGWPCASSDITDQTNTGLCTNQNKDIFKGHLICYLWAATYIILFKSPLDSGISVLSSTTEQIHYVE